MKKKHAMKDKVYEGLWYIIECYGAQEEEKINSIWGNTVWKNYIWILMVLQMGSSFNVISLLTLLPPYLFTVCGHPSHFLVLITVLQGQQSTY